MKQAGSKLYYLLDDVCSRLGFCLPADARHRIASLEHLDASTFAHVRAAVLVCPPLSSSSDPNDRIGNPAGLLSRH